MHAYFATSNAFTHDSLMVLSEESDNLWQISLGRFVMPIYWAVRGNVHVPWMILAFSSLYAGVSCYFLYKLFISDTCIIPLYICVLAGLLIGTPVASLQNATYIPWADIYQLAMLLAIIGVYLTVRYRYGIIAGVILTALSIGLYPAYYSVSCILSIFVFWIVLFNNKRCLKQVFLYLFRLLSMLCFSLVLYYLLNKTALHLYGIKQAQSYNSISNVFAYIDGSTNINGLIYYALRACGKVFYKLFISPWSHNPSVVAICNIVYFLYAISCVLTVVYSMYKNRKEQKGFSIRIVLFLFSSIALFFSAGLMYFLNSGNTHALMYAPMYCLYLCPFILIKIIQTDGRFNKPIVLSSIARRGLQILLLVLLFDSFIYTNQLYLYKRLAYDRTNLVVNRIINRIETDPRCGPDTTVVLVGNMIANDYLSFDSALTHVFSADDTGANIRYGITYYDTMKWYADNILGSGICLADDRMVQEYSRMLEVKQMPAFPSAGCIRLIDGKLIVKIGD